MSYYPLRTIIEPEDNGGWHGLVPLLSGVHTQGDTLEEVKANLHEAIICHLQGLQRDNEPIPQEIEAFEQIQSFSQDELVFA